MSTRTRRTTTRQDEPLYDDFRDDSLEGLSSEELEELLFEEEEDEKKGIWNLPTIAGLSMIGVGIVYLLQEMGLGVGLDLGGIVAFLPWLAGILIILLGFGVLSWRPKKGKKKVKKAVDVKTGKKKKVVVEPKAATADRKRLSKTRDKKIAGVCGGIAEYFNIDPTLVRIAFVIGTIMSQGTFLAAYILLAIVMPKPEAMSAEERITIIRDS
jgi:phage shock protein C